MKTPPMLSGGLPILGHALQMMNNREKLFRRGFEELGDIFSIQLGNQNAVVLGNKAYNRSFYNQTDKELNISDVYDFLHAAIGEVLFTAGRDEYYNQRPVLQAVFKRERMAQYIDAMNKEVKIWLEGLGTEGKINIADEMLRLTQNVAAHAFLGAGFRDELGDDFWAAYVDISKSLDPVLPANLPLPKFMRRDKAKKYIRQVFQTLAEKRRQNPEKYDDLITILLTTPQKDGTFMSEEGIATMFVGLMFAGHETTAGQAAWTIIQLLQHPSYLKLVQDEISQNLQYGQNLDAHSLPALNHLYWAIDETSRLNPSADLQMRLVEEPIQIGEYEIPVGSRLIVASAISHFDKDTFSNAQTYNPMRFSPEQKEGSDPFATVSFGGGIHKCTGMNFAKNEMAIITAMFLQQYDVELQTKNPYIERGVGANRPSTSIVSYRRKPLKALLDEKTINEATAAGCPHISQRQAAES